MIGLITTSFRLFGWFLLICSLILVGIEANAFLQLGYWRILRLENVLVELAHLLGEPEQSTLTISEPLQLLSILTWPSWVITTTVGCVFVFLFMRRV